MEHRQQDMKPLEVGQVGIVVRDVDKAIGQLSSLWNIGPFRIHEIDLPDAFVHGKQTRLRAKLAFAQAGPIELELIEPGEGDSIYSEFLRAKGEGAHHFGLYVSDMESELARLRERGIGVLQSGETPGIIFAYMDTEGLAGVILELLQRKHNLA